MGKSRSGLTATGIAVVSFLFILLAFSTPYWLQTDGTLPRPKFNNIGLWSVCFKEFQDPHFWYDVTFENCWWIFEEEFYIIFDILLPPFFVTVQFFFTFCFTLQLIAGFGLLLYLACSRENYRFVHLLVFLGGCLLLAAFCGTIAVWVFGLYGDGRDWMPNWEHNNIGWSYALGVIGVILSYASGVIFLIEARRHLIKRRKEEKLRASYNMDQMRSSHSNI